MQYFSRQLGDGNGIERVGNSKWTDCNKPIVSFGILCYCPNALRNLRHWAVLVTEVEQWLSLFLQLVSPVDINDFRS
jgi:hypothetical protein